MTTLLIPTFSSQKSFYGKARITQSPEKIILTSYTTNVAELDLLTRKLEIKGEFSRNTMIHIREFMRQFCPEISTDLKTIRKIINGEFIFNEFNKK